MDYNTPHGSRNHRRRGPSRSPHRPSARQDPYPSNIATRQTSGSRYNFSETSQHLQPEFNFDQEWNRTIGEVLASDNHPQAEGSHLPTQAEWDTFNETGYTADLLQPVPQFQTFAPCQGASYYPSDHVETDTFDQTGYNVDLLPPAPQFQTFDQYQGASYFNAPKPPPSDSYPTNWSAAGYGNQAEVYHSDAVGVKEPHQAQEVLPQLYQSNSLSPAKELASLPAQAHEAEDKSLKEVHTTDQTSSQSRCDSTPAGIAETDMIGPLRPQLDDAEAASRQPSIMSDRLSHSNQGRKGESREGGRYLRGGNLTDFREFCQRLPGYENKPFPLYSCSASGEPLGESAEEAVFGVTVEDRTFESRYFDKPRKEEATIWHKKNLVNTHDCAFGKWTMSHMLTLNKSKIQEALIGRPLDESIHFEMFNRRVPSAQVHEDYDSFYREWEYDQTQNHRYQPAKPGIFLFTDYSDKYVSNLSPTCAVKIQGGAETIATLYNVPMKMTISLEPTMPSEHS